MVSVSSVSIVGLFVIPVAITIIVLHLEIQDYNIQAKLAFLTALSIGGFFSTLKLIPVVSKLCIKAGLGGFDINKGGTEKIPESLGLVVGTVYLTIAIMFQPIFGSIIGQYNAALTAICFMIFLGFADDVLDLRWAIKIGLSLLVVYSGPTQIIIPKPARFLFGASIQLGVLYHLIMSLWAVFCTNSINILAGINGLEVGQSIIIGVSMLIHSMIQLVFLNETDPTSTLLSICVILPFIMTSTALLYYNWYPSKVFVGDTFTYFAGMTLAVAGILGHSTKTLILFFIPQLINFAISLPQLFGFIPCPRHRLPRFMHLYFVTKIVNLMLIVFGPMNERDLCLVILLFQTLCSAGAFFVRYYLSTLFYDK